MIKTFFILWFTTSPGNYHTLTTLKFDTEVECLAAGKAMVQSYNDNSWGDIDMSGVRCIKVEVKE